MKYESQRIAMAELEGYTDIRPIESSIDDSIIGYFGKINRITKCQPWPPNYDTLDDCQRVFKGMKLITREHVFVRVRRMLLEQGNHVPLSEFEATPEQWRTAILKAVGKWEES
jgi:hypothetical protein